MKKKTAFNGAVLDYTIPGFKTLSVSGRQFNDVEIESSENVTDGSAFHSKRIPERKLTVTFMLKPSSVTLKEAQDMLLAALNTSEPKQLIFSDEPQVYFNAMFQEAKVEEEHDKVRSGTLTFLCLDPFKHSTTLKEFTAVAGDDGILRATITNNGTVDVPITYEITHTADNGYIGIVSEKGAMQYGFIEEADGETYKQTERLSSIADFISADDDHGTCYLQTDADTSGGLGTKSLIDATWLGLGAVGNGNGWNGGLRTITMPADSEGVYGSKNFQLGMHRWFQKDHYSEIGLQIINIMGDEHTQIAGIKIYSTVETYENAVAEFWANGRMYERKLFRAGQAIWSPGMKANTWNPYRYDIGTDLIRKEGQKITFYYDSRYMEWNIPELENVEATRIQVGFFRANTRPKITANYYKSIDFYKLNVEKWKDNPNRYSAGDVVRIEGDTRKVYVNGMPRQGDEVLGTTYFKASSGTTSVEFTKSDWAEDITAKAYIREAWL